MGKLVNLPIYQSLIYQFTDLPTYQFHPWRCLCFWLEQMTRTTPRRRTILHLSQIRFTDARTFIARPIHASRGLG
jgi:hypothetical protein